MGVRANGISTEAYSAGTAPVLSLNAVTTGNGSVLDAGVVRSTAVWSLTGGTSVTAGAAALQGSLDGANWYALGAAVTVPTTATTTQTVETSAYARFYRVVVSTTVTGGAATASVAAFG